jgi:hypothetical protein
VSPAWKSPAGDVVTGTSSPAGPARADNHLASSIKKPTDPFRQLLPVSHPPLPAMTASHLLQQRRGEFRRKKTVITPKKDVEIN